MHNAEWLPPALTALFSLAVLSLSWAVRQLVKLTTSVAVLTTEVRDLRKGGSDRLAEIMAQARRNERVSGIVAATVIIGWAMRGWIVPRRPRWPRVMR